MRPKVILFSADGNIVNSPDFKESVPALFGKGYRMLIISSHGQKFIEDFSKKSELDNYFEYVPSREDMIISIEEIVKHFNAPAEMMVLVGEENDMKIAKKFGVNFIGVANSKEEKEILDKAGCMIILNSVADLT